MNLIMFWTFFLPSLHSVYNCALQPQGVAEIVLSGSFSVGWAKAGIAIVRDPDDWGMVVQKTLLYDIRKFIK